MKENIEKDMSITWIPCSERLPKEDGLYLVTIQSWDDDEDDRCVRTLGYDVEDSSWDDEGWWDVITWSPMPEPFRGSK